jgi:hypothetical protein
MANDLSRKAKIKPGSVKNFEQLSPRDANYLVTSLDG